MGAIKTDDPKGHKISIQVAKFLKVTYCCFQGVEFVFQKVQSGYLIEVWVFFSFYFGLFSVILCFRSTHAELWSSVFNHLHRKGKIKSDRQAETKEEKKKKIMTEDISCMETPERMLVGEVTGKTV